MASKNQFIENIDRDLMPDLKRNLRAEAFHLHDLLATGAGRCARKRGRTERLIDFSAAVGPRTTILACVYGLSNHDYVAKKCAFAFVFAGPL